MYAPNCTTRYWIPRHRIDNCRGTIIPFMQHAEPSGPPYFSPKLSGACRALACASAPRTKPRASARTSLPWLRCPPAIKGCSRQRSLTSMLLSLLGRTHKNDPCNWHQMTLRSQGRAAGVWGLVYQRQEGTEIGRNLPRRARWDRCNVVRYFGVRRPCNADGHR